MIASAFSWVADVAEFLGSLLPRLVVVQSTHRAVKYALGRRPTLLEPGVHVYWPVVSPVESCAVVRQTIDVPARLVETADGYSVVCSAVVEYEIDDAVAFLARTENGYDSVRLVAGSAVWEYVRESTLEELRSQSDIARRLMVGAMQDDLRPYGVLVLGAQVADLARVRALHLTGLDGRAVPAAAEGYVA